MPFTLSHPAVVLPLARGRLVPSALVMGSMAPDLPYFLPFFRQRWLTHMFTGTITVDLGLALALLGLYHPLLKWPLIALCPAWIRDRVAAPARAFDQRRMNDLGWVLVSAAIGTFSHVAWDAFTHPDAPGVQWLPALAEPAAFGLPGYKVAQYASGVAGLLVIAGWVYRWLRRAVPAADGPPGLPTRGRVAVLAATAAAGLAGGCYGALSWLPLNSDRTDLHARTVGGVIGVIAFAALALIVHAVAFHALDRRRRPVRDDTAARAAVRSVSH